MTTQQPLLPCGQHASKKHAVSQQVENAFPTEGGCACGATRYRLLTPPMYVHCCHCTWCQRETGSAFVINAMIEADRVEVLKGEPEIIHTPSASGKGQKITRCPTCKVALWSNYAGAGDAVRFVRVGTLDHPNVSPPNMHVFTSTKQPWVIIPAEHSAAVEFYDLKEHWPAESLARIKAIRSS